MVRQYPQLPAIEAAPEAEISERMAKNSGPYSAKGAGLADSLYNVPVVFHIVHDYGEEYLTDDQIYNVVADLNRMFSRSNPDSNVIAPYAGNIPGTTIKYRGKANIVFHLATIDPFGNPTRGITRNHSYLGNNAGDNAKLEQWPPGDYLNIWVIHNFTGIHSGDLAYATSPSAAHADPLADGIIIIMQPGSGTSININHSITHSIPLQNLSGNNKVYFKFRYTAGTNNVYSQLGTGNNFYMDMIGVNDYAPGVTPAKLEADGIILSPNPTSGVAAVTIKGGNNATAVIRVTDMTGRLVYTTNAQLTSAATITQIPAECIAVKGNYLVQVVAGGRMMTQNLSVYRLHIKIPRQSAGVSI